MNTKRYYLDYYTQYRYGIYNFQCINDPILTYDEYLEHLRIELRLDNRTLTCYSEKLNIDIIYWYEGNHTTDPFSCQENRHSHKFEEIKQFLENKVYDYIGRNDEPDNTIDIIYGDLMDVSKNIQEILGITKAEEKCYPNYDIIYAIRYYFELNENFFFVLPHDLSKDRSHSENFKFIQIYEDINYLHLGIGDSEERHDIIIDKISKDINLNMEVDLPEEEENIIRKKIENFFPQELSISQLNISDIFEILNNSWNTLILISQGNVGKLLQVGVKNARRA
jgi:hypothetical protein